MRRRGQAKQEASIERERRIRAERQASMLRAQNTVLRQQLKTLTRDSVPSPLSHRPARAT